MNIQLFVNILFQQGMSNVPKMHTGNRLVLEGYHKQAMIFRVNKIHNIDIKYQQNILIKIICSLVYISQFNDTCFNLNGGRRQGLYILLNVKLITENITCLARVSTPLSLYCISARICSNSRLRRATLFFARHISDFSRSGSYFVLPTLELEFTVTTK